MSLINQVLMDLDKRAPEEAPSKETLLSEAIPAPQRRKAPNLLRLGLILLVLAGIGVSSLKWGGSWPSAGKIAQQTGALSASVVPTADAAVNQDAPHPTAPLPASVDPTHGRVIETPSAAVEEGSAELRHLYFVQNGDQLRVTAAFSHIPEYRLIQRAQGRQIVLELPVGTKVVSLPNAGIPPMLQKMACETHNDRIQLVFSFERACRYDELSLKDHPEEKNRSLFFVVRPEAPDVRPTTVAEAPSAPKPSVTSPDGPGDVSPSPAPEASTAAKEFVRQAVRPTDRQQAEELYQKGITAFHKGQVGKAEEALRAALTIEPSHVSVRDALLHLLDRQNRRNQVKALLVEGLHNVPDHLPYRVQLARLLIEEGNLSRAESELTRDPLPSASESPDLHAMLATVSLRQGRYDEAANTYRTLLATNPDQAIWWMGLGIALENDAALDQAWKAYSKALVRDGLSDGLRTFIRQRLAALRNAQTGQPTDRNTFEEKRS